MKTLNQVKSSYKYLLTFLVLFSFYTIACGNSDAPQTPAITLNNQIYLVNIPVSVPLTNSGGKDITECKVEPSLPTGLMLAPSNDANTCTISGTPTAITSEQAYTITATNQHGDGMVSTNIEVEGVNLSVGAVADTLVHVIPPPNGYELGVFLPNTSIQSSSTATVANLTLSYDTSNINTFNILCEVNMGATRPVFDFRITGSLVQDIGASISRIATVTALGTRNKITINNEGLFRTNFDTSEDLNLNGIINGLELACDDGGGSRITVTGDNTIQGQYFPSTTQTTPPGNGYRFPTITDGDPDSLFSINDRTGQIRTSKAVPNTPLSYVLTLSNGDRLGIVVNP